MMKTVQMGGRWPILHRRRNMCSSGTMGEILPPYTVVSTSTIKGEWMSRTTTVESFCRTQSIRWRTTDRTLRRSTSDEFTVELEDRLPLFLTSKRENVEHQHLIGPNQMILRTQERRVVAVLLAQSRFSVPTDTTSERTNQLLSRTSDDAAVVCSSLEVKVIGLL